jgi:hypothetical protein
MMQRSLQLSEDQKRELLNLRQNFLSIIGSLRAERARLVDQLHQMVGLPMPRTCTPLCAPIHALLPDGLSVAFWVCHKSMGVLSGTCNSP